MNYQVNRPRLLRIKFAKIILKSYLILTKFLKIILYNYFILEISFF